MIGWAFFAIFASSANAGPLSFDEAVRAMLARDREVQAVGYEAEAASAASLGKRYHLLPTVALEGSETWAKGLEKVSAVQGTASLSLFRFGADALLAGAANDLERAARAKLARTRLDREKKAVDALLELIRTAESRRVLAALEGMGQESVTIAERQFASGRVARQEVDKVKIDLADTRFQKDEAEQALASARAAVTALLGSSEVRPEFPWKDRIEKFKPEPIDRDAILRSRPEWIQAEAESRAADATARSSFRGFLPELGARASYGWTRDPLISNDYRTGWVGVLTLSIPIFSGFRDYAAYRVQSENSGAVDARLEGIKRDVLAEVESVPTRFEIARQSALDREAILRTSKDLYQANLSRFRQGRATSDELNIDLNRYLKTQLGAITGWVAAHQAYVAWAHLRGVCATDCGSR
jgi:outer membrane protein TolC